MVLAALCPLLCAVIEFKDFTENMVHEVRTPMLYLICVVQVVADEKESQTQLPTSSASWRSIVSSVACGHLSIPLLNCVFGFGSFVFFDNIGKDSGMD